MSVGPSRIYQVGLSDLATGEAWTEVNTRVRRKNHNNRNHLECLQTFSVVLQKGE